MKPAPAEAVGRLLGAGEVPGPRQPPRCSAYGASSPTSRARPWKRSTLPAPPHWATEAAPRAAAPRAGARTARRGRATQWKTALENTASTGLVEHQLGQLGPNTLRAVAEGLARLRRPSTAPRPPPPRCPRGRRSSSSRVTRPLPQPASSTRLVARRAPAGRAPRPPTRPAAPRRGRSCAASQSRGDSGAVVTGRWSRGRCARARPRRPRSRPRTAASRRCRRARRAAGGWISASISNATSRPSKRTTCASQVDLRLVRVHQGVHVRRAERHRQQADLGAVGVEDVGERLGATIALKP